MHANHMRASLRLLLAFALCITHGYEVLTRPGGSTAGRSACGIARHRTTHPIDMMTDATPPLPAEQAIQSALGQQQQQQQQEQVRQTWEQNSLAPWFPRWGLALKQGALAIAAAVAITGSIDVRSAAAENELAALASQKSTAELVKPGCFATSCKQEVEACGADGDCVKGLACSAKCLGDAQCTMGCFARYGNPTLDKVLQCTIEDAGCIQIATQEPGADGPYDAPRPPKALVKATPASMSGRWYKVMGFNPNYDCFECQKNSFATGAEAATLAGREVALDVGPSTAAVEVEYSLPRERTGRPAEAFHTRLVESLEFDTAPGAVRTAHTEGHMFGLTFWENWSVIGENARDEPEFKFIHYSGRTSQNTLNDMSSNTM